MRSWGVIQRPRGWPRPIMRANVGPGRASDIDVAVLPEEPLPAGLLQEIRDALESSQILYSVDLVDLTTAEPSLCKAVFRDGVPWRN